MNKAAKQWFFMGGATFLPSQISGLKLWYDMTDNANVSQSGGLLTGLTDKSGNANNSVPTGTQRGTIATDGTTGKQVLTLSGSPQFLPMTTELILSNWSVYIVCKNTNMAGITGYTGSTSLSPNYYIKNNAHVLSIGSNSDGILNQFNDDSLGDWGILSVRITKSSAALFSPGANGRVLRGSANPTIDHRIGKLLVGNTDYFVGSFAGALIYDSYLSDANHLKVIQYLFSQFNLSTRAQKIIGFGDSITRGVGASVYANCWLSLLATNLGKLSANSGITGTPFQDTGSASNNGYGRYQSQLLEYNYKDRVYIIYGTNDVSGVATGGTVGIYQTELDAMIADLISKGYSTSNIYLGSPPYRQFDNSSALNQQYGAAVSAVATKYGTHFADLYTAMKSGGADTLMFDGLHPNDAGHSLIATTFLAS